jgi:peroxiredoxin
MYIGRAMISVGDRAPDFSARCTDGRTLSLSQFRGRPVVIYFFPRAFTPGCTAETRRFRDNYDDLQRFDAEVIGISTDDHDRQCEFAEAEKVKFPLIGDKNAEIQALYGVKLPILKSNRRVTFVIDEDGAVAAVFHHEFQVLRHMDDVRQFFEKRSRFKASDAPASTSARPSPESKK